MKAPKFVRRGKNTIRHATYKAWSCRVIQLEAPDDWFAQVVPPQKHSLYRPGSIGWGTVSASQEDAERWCQDRVDELEAGGQLDKTG